MKFSKMARKCFKPNNLSNLLLIVVVVVALFLLIKFFINKQNNDNDEGFEGQKTLLLNHMTGCGHCEKLMPDWNKCEKQNKSNIKMKKVEVNEDPSYAKKYDVQGFPTILLLDSNGEKLDTYDGPRTLDGLLSYLKSKTKL